LLFCLNNLNEHDLIRINFSDNDHLIVTDNIALFVFAVHKVVLAQDVKILGALELCTFF